MPSYILVGDDDGFDAFISRYKKENSIKDYDTSIFNEKILVEDTRNLIKSINLKSSLPKLYVLKNEITTEAQNALLKNIEELESYNTIIFCTQAIDLLLPTVQSRCFIVSFNKSSVTYDNISILISEYLEEKVGQWELVERISESKSENLIPALQSGLREVFLTSDIAKQRKAYFFSKKLLRLSPLIEKNNINVRIALEKVFAI